ncbi:recombination protein RecR [bacterium]|nr:recombination protein RecR [bacterium]
MKYSSKSLERLIEAFNRLPGIGTKSAQRMALYLLETSRDECENLAKAIIDLKDMVGHCSRCFNLTEDDICDICSDVRRNQKLICVVEEPKDLLAIERTGVYRGVFHVLGGALSPLEGVGESNLRIRELMLRIDSGADELILATNPTVEGEMTAAHLAKLSKDKVKVTRIARGIPYGGALEFNDAVTVAKAMEGRIDL